MYGGQVKARHKKGANVLSNVLPFVNPERLIFPYTNDYAYLLHLSAQHCACHPFPPRFGGKLPPNGGNVAYPRREKSCPWRRWEYIAIFKMQPWLFPQRCLYGNLCGGTPFRHGRKTSVLLLSPPPGARLKTRAGLCQIKLGIADN